MEPDRQQIENIFYGAVELPEGAERERWLGERCAGDAGLRAEVEALLRAAGEEHREQERALGERSSTQAGLPERIGPYRILRLLGSGGMGSVYLGERSDGEFQMQVAVKVLSAAWGGEEFRRYFLGERQILASLNHPNVTRLLDGGTLPGTGEPYLVMEYVDGAPLDQYLDSRKASVADRLRMFLPICAATGYLHQNLILHRDLKPGNILITGSGVPKLLDFGAAKLLERDGAQTVTMGPLTLRYASPEQMGGRPVSTRSDVFSLGVLLFESLTGAWPFGDPERAFLQSERRAADPAGAVTGEAARVRGMSEGALRDTLRGDLTAVLSKALREDPAERYAGAAELAADLQRYLNHEPVAAKEPTLWYRTRMFARRRWLPLAATAAAVVALVGMAALAILARREAVRELYRSNAVRSVLVDLIAGGAQGNLGLNMTLAEAARRTSQTFNQPAVQASLSEDARMEVHRQLGFVLAWGSDKEAALAHLQQAAQLGEVIGTPRERTINALALARGLHALGRWKEAVTAARTAHTLAQTLAEPLLRLETIVQLFTDVEYAEPGSPEPESLVEQWGVLAARTPPNVLGAVERATGLLNGAQVFYMRGRFAECEQWTREAIALGDESTANHLAYHNLGKLAARRGDWKEAVKWRGVQVRLVRRSVPKDHPLQLLAEAELGRAQYFAGGAGRSAGLALVKRSGELSVANADKPFAAIPLWAYGDVLAAEGDGAGAERYGRLAIRAAGEGRGRLGDPAVMAQERLLGRALAVQGKFAEALPHMQTYLRHAEANPRFDVELAEARELVALVQRGERPRHQAIAVN